VAVVLFDMLYDVRLDLVDYFWDWIHGASEY